MFGDKKGLERRLREKGGISAPATVTRAKQLASASKGNYTEGPMGPSDTSSYTGGGTDLGAWYSLELAVHPERAEPFTAKVRQFVNAPVTEGSQVRVLFDPNDHSKLCLDVEAMWDAFREQMDA
jgi:hypothetical protein